MKRPEPVPRTALVRQNDTHRLIPSKYSPGGDSVLTRIAEDEAGVRVRWEIVLEELQHPSLYADPEPEE